MKRWATSVGLWMGLAVFGSSAWAVPHGDANCDGAVNVTDVQLTIIVVLGIPISEQLDGNLDGVPDACESSSSAVGCGPNTAISPAGDSCVVAPGVLEAAIAEGFDQGVDSIDTQGFYDAGFAAGQAAVPMVDGATYCGWNSAWNPATATCEISTYVVALLDGPLTVESLVGADLSHTDLVDANLYGLDLTGALLPSDPQLVDGLSAWDLVSCPAALTPGWACVQTANGLFALVGPTAKLGFAALDLTGVDLSGLDLTGADLSQVTLASVELTNTDLTGADLSGVDLTGAHGVDLAGCPAKLPAGWKCVEHTLVGPGADLTGADLTGADLTGIHGIDLAACPAALPVSWKCIQHNLVGPTANLSGADLSGADLGGAKLTGVNLTGANLTGAAFKGADLSVANLSHVHAIDLGSCPSGLPPGWLCIKYNLVGPTADLSGASLFGKTLQGISLFQANLTGADLKYTKLIDVDLMFADLTDVDLQSAKMLHVDLTGTDMSTANVKYLHADNVMSCPDVSPDGWTCIAKQWDGLFVLVGVWADLQGASLQGLDFTGLDLRFTQLQGAFLNETNFSSANLAYAKLAGADLTGAQMDGSNLHKAQWSNTTCPDGYLAAPSQDTCCGHLNGATTTAGCP